jgi:hypothetical protein
MILAVCTVAAFLAVVLPERIAALGANEAKELAAARAQATAVHESVTRLWADLAPGSPTLPADQLGRDLAAAQAAERATGDVLNHISAAQALLAEADGVPFQLHHPAFVATDGPVLEQLQKAMLSELRLAHGATLQLLIAQHLESDANDVNHLGGFIAANDWSGAARASGPVQADLKVRRDAAMDPETLLDPLWSKWADAMVSYSFAVQQYSLAAAAGRPSPELSRSLASTRDQVGATWAAATANAASWQARSIQTLIDSVSAQLKAAA